MSVDNYQLLHDALQAGSERAYEFGKRWAEEGLGDVDDPTETLASIHGGLAQLQHHGRPDAPFRPPRTLEDFVRGCFEVFDFCVGFDPTAFFHHPLFSEIAVDDRFPIRVLLVYGAVFNKASGKTKRTLYQRTLRQREELCLTLIDAIDTAVTVKELLDLTLLFNDIAKDLRARTARETPAIYEPVIALPRLVKAVIACSNRLCPGLHQDTEQGDLVVRTQVLMNIFLQFIPALCRNEVKVYAAVESVLFEELDALTDMTRNPEVSKDVRIDRLQDLREMFKWLGKHSPFPLWRKDLVSRLAARADRDISDELDGFDALRIVQVVASLVRRIQEGVASESNSDTDAEGVALHRGGEFAPDHSNLIEWEGIFTRACGWLKYDRLRLDVMEMLEPLACLCVLREDRAAKLSRVLEACLADAEDDLFWADAFKAYVPLGILFRDKYDSVVRAHGKRLLALPIFEGEERVEDRRAIENGMDDLDG